MIPVVDLGKYRQSFWGLTPLEIQCLKSAFESSKGNGHDFGYTKDIVVLGIPKKAVGGAISSLLKKGLIVRDEEFGQFAFGNFGQSAYLCSEIVKEFLATL